MLAELVDRGIRADRVYGASVGAVNAAAYCGDPTPGGIEKLADVWRNISGEDVFPRSRVHGPWRFVQHLPSVHSSAGLRRIIEDGVTFVTMEEATVPFEVVVTSLSDGKERWIGRGPVVEAVLASAAIPALFPPVTIDGDVLIDGGVVNNVPLSRAIERGARRVYVLLCGSVHFQPPIPQRPVEAVLTALYVAVHARFTRELASVPRGVEVVVFAGGADMGADYRDFSGAPEMIEAGRRAVRSVLDGEGAGGLTRSGGILPGTGDRRPSAAPGRSPAAPGAHTAPPPTAPKPGEPSPGPLAAGVDEPGPGRAGTTGHR
jgi:NTE family protein